MDINKFRNEIKSLNKDDFDKIYKIISKEYKIRKNNNIKFVSKKLFEMFPNYDIILIGEKRKDIEGNILNKSINELDYYSYSDFEKFFNKKVMNNVFSNKDNKINILIKTLYNNINLNKYPNCENKDSLYFIYIDKNLNIDCTKEI